MGEAVVYVHGLWMSGGESLLLRRRLSREFGMDVHPFRYATASSTMTEITSRLQSFVRGLEASRLHFVGHSLGGLVIYRFLERYPKQPPGRVVVGQMIDAAYESRGIGGAANPRQQNRPGGRALGGWLVRFRQANGPHGRGSQRHHPNPCKHRVSPFRCHSLSA